MNGSEIEVYGDGVHVRVLDVARRSVADFLRDAPEEERELLLVQAIEVGAFCLERAAAARDLDFVRHKVDELMSGIERAVAALPADLEATVLEKMGDGDGQVLAPIRSLVESVNQGIDARIRDVRGLLTDDLDPSKATSTLGAALGKVQELLDPARKDSVQGVLCDAVASLSDGNGSLAVVVKSAVADAVRPLSDEVSRLGQLVAGAQAVDAALQETTKKGIPFELEVVAEVQAWGARMGVSVEHVGQDNRPGDVLVCFAGPTEAAGLTVVIEVRDRGSAVGRQVVSDTLSKAMRERKADAAVYLSRSTAGLAKELGDWGEGESSGGPFVATTQEYLLLALRWLLAQEQLRRRAESIDEVDRAAIEAQVDRIRTILKRVKTINTNVTSIRTSAAAVEAEADTLRSDIRAALGAIEDALSTGAAKSAA